jgi:hypothetical protein
LALTAAGRVVAWGYDGNGQTDVPTGLSNVVAVVAEDWRSLALTADGRVVLWGTEEPTNTPSGLSDVVAIAAADYHDLALTGLPPGVAAPALAGSPFLVATAERPFNYRINAKNGVNRLWRGWSACWFGFAPGGRLDHWATQRGRELLGGAHGEQQLWIQQFESQTICQRTSGACHRQHWLDHCGFGQQIQ